jgi:hypothetical protein
MLGLGQGCQEGESQNPETESAYETTPKWHSFFFDQTGRFSGQRRRLYETTPKWHGFLIYRRVASMTWIKQRTAEYRISKEGIWSILSKKIERSDSTLRHSSIVIRYSLF